jgi:hypothetical protein
MGGSNSIARDALSMLINTPRAASGTPGSRTISGPVAISASSTVDGGDARSASSLDAPPAPLAEGREFDAFVV